MPTDVICTWLISIPSHPMPFSQEVIFEDIRPKASAQKQWKILFFPLIFKAVGERCFIKAIHSILSMTALQTSVTVMYRYAKTGLFPESSSTLTYSFASLLRSGVLTSVTVKSKTGPPAMKKIPGTAREIRRVSAALYMVQNGIIHISLMGEKRGHIRHILNCEYHRHHQSPIQKLKP